MDTNKLFLDFQGLAKYDKLIKKFVTEQSQTNEQGIENVVQALADYKTANDALLQETNEAVEANAAAIEVLNGDADTEGSVASQVKTAVEGAIESIVDGADEAFDTLKEVAEWIKSDETASAELINKVGENADNIEANAEAIVKTNEKVDTLKEYVDERDEYYYNAIQSISDASISSLFLDKVTVAEGETVADAIAALKENEMLVLEADCAEDLSVPANAVIDANGNTLSGKIVVAEGATVMNAVFTGTVTVA